MSVVIRSCETEKLLSSWYTKLIGIELTPSHVGPFQAVIFHFSDIFKALRNNLQSEKFYCDI